MRVQVRGKHSEPVTTQLFLAASDHDHATSGRVLIESVRLILQGLPAEFPIMHCEDTPNVPRRGTVLHLGHEIRLSQQRFEADSKLVIWAGESVCVSP